MSGVGGALVDLLLQRLYRQGPGLHHVLEWLTDVARPPEGIRLITDDGAEYTGVVLIEGNRPKLMFALRVEVPRHPMNRASQELGAVDAAPTPHLDEDDTSFP